MGARRDDKQINKGLFLTSGTLLITPKLFDEDTNFILSIMGDLFQVTYMGITNVFVENSSTVSAGTEIGRSGSAGQCILVNVKLYSPNAEILTPELVIYFESKL